MSEQTKIAWCDSTVNFWSGCTKVSPGCANCYAEGLSKRGLPAIGGWGMGAERKRSKSAVKDALAYNRKPWICDQTGDHLTDEQFKLHRDGTGGLLTYHRRRIFSLSLGDMNDEEINAEWRAEAWHTIWKCADVTWIICSKRWEFWKTQMGELLACQAATGSLPYDEAFFKWIYSWVIEGNFQPNIILLTSVENQEQAEQRIPELLKIPAACRGLSLEPLLGPVDFDEWFKRYYPAKSETGGNILNWLIIGGESGANARPCNVDWIRSLIEQGKSAGVATFVKQLGAKPTQTLVTFGYGGTGVPSGHPIAGKITDKKGGDPSEWPADLRVQEWPKL